MSFLFEGGRSVEALMDVVRNARLTFRGIVVRDETSERAGRGVVRGHRRRVQAIVTGSIRRPISSNVTRRAPVVPDWSSVATTLVRWSGVSGVNAVSSPSVVQTMTATAVEGLGIGRPLRRLCGAEWPPG
ncbi:hypothetical protein BGV54_13535 [Burkholderia ubonensis]|nr:hypothetical protein BGV54_13535 [Burkholderia ubonensis]